jgi:hypothetical protein
MTQARRFSICLLDDKIPLSLDSGLIDHRELSSLILDDTKWKDAELLSLVKQLDSKKDSYILSGFLHCDHFLNYIDEVIFSPDIIIFDWDYPAGSSPEDALFKILESQFSQVFIFTGVDAEGAVDNVIAKEKFKQYENRIKLIKKSDTNSVDDLKNKIESSLNIFSFKYSNELKRKTLRGVDLILSSLEQLSFDEFIRFFGEKITENGVTSHRLSSFEFTEIIADKLKARLIDIGMDEDPAPVPDGAHAMSENLMREIWGFRLYHQPKDGVVRRGDIVEIAGRKVLIMSSDCDLSRFWQKNMGCLMVTPLLRIDDVSFKSDLNVFNNRSIDNFSISSLTNPRGIECFTVLPGLEIEDNAGVRKYLDYIVAAKATYSIAIKKPDTVTDVKSALRYEHIDGIGDSFETRKRVADPFLTPLIQFIVENLTGLGVPDFPKSLSDDLKTKIIGLKNNAGT